MVGLGCPKQLSKHSKQKRQGEVPVDSRHCLALGAGAGGLCTFCSGFISMFAKNFSLYEAVDFRTPVMFKTACGTLKLYLEYSKSQRFMGKRECFPIAAPFPGKL